MFDRHLEPRKAALQNGAEMLAPGVVELQTQALCDGRPEAPNLIGGGGSGAHRNVAP
jgi:hypothetical protein